MPQVKAKEQRNGVAQPQQSIAYTLTTSGELSSRITKYKKDKSFTSEQEVMRIAIADFLQRQGY